MHTYKIIIRGYGSQVNIGTISSDMYSYWTSITDSNLITDQLFPNFDNGGYADDVEIDTDDITQIGMWKRHNDILALCSPLIDYLHILVYDESNKIIYTQDSIDPKSCRTVNSDEIGSGYFIKTTFDKKGEFVSIELEAEEFDPTKLSFHSKSVDGDEYLDRVMYNGKMKKNKLDDSQRQSDDDKRTYYLIKNK